IFGNERCASAHPSDPAAALLALGATLRTDRREFPVGELYRLPTEDDRNVTALEPGELILELEVPRPEASDYLKAMDRARWAFPLAAGAATRFGSPKQALLLEPVLERVRQSSVDGVLVVLGAHEVETRAPTVHCPDWEQGPGASLRCGLRALPAEAEAAVVVLADGPNLSPAAVDRVLTAWRETQAPVLAASYGGTRLH